jgi:hypothetical protein
MAWKSARLAGLEVDASVFQGARATMSKLTDRDGRTHYARLGDRGASVNMTALAMLSRVFMDGNADDRLIRKGMPLLARALPRWAPGSHDFYYWYNGTLALFQCDGPNGATWRAWNAALAGALCPNQRTAGDGCAGGSWDTDGWNGGIAGRVYGTAINVLTLEVYYRYSSVFGAR